MAIHVLPIEDWIEHSEDTTCLCDPTVGYEDGEMIVIHEAVDGRDAPIITN